MDRTEGAGLGVAVALHTALFAALVLSALKPPELPKTKTDAVEVSLVDEVALESSSPNPSSPAEPAPAPAEISAPEPAPPAQPVEAAPPPPPKPVVKPRPTPTPTPKPAPKAPPPKPQPKQPAPKQPQKPAVAKPAPAKPAPAKPAKPLLKPGKRPGLTSDLVDGFRQQPGPKVPNPGAGAPGKTVTPAIASSLGAEVRRQLKPHWKSPTGADVELLRTTVSARLNRDGSIAGAPEVIAQTGVNDSNRAQAKLHADQAIRAVRLAAPFKLPADYYDAWKEIRPVFDKRLSQ